MPRCADITVSPAHLRLDASRKGKLVLTATNAVHRDFSARADVKTQGQTRPEWVKTDVSRFSFGADKTQSIEVSFEAPADAPAGSYSFQIQIVDLGNPDEFYESSEVLTVDVPAAGPVKGPSWWARHRWLVLAIVGGAVVIGGGVTAALVLTRGGGQAPKAGAGVLARLPAETQMVAGIDFARLRQASFWSTVEQRLGTANPGARDQLQEVTRETGFDLLRQVDGLVFALPAEVDMRSGMAFMLRGRGLDEQRLVAYARSHLAQANDRNDELFSFQRAGRTLWAFRREPTSAGFFADAETVVLGSGGWAEKIADLVGAGAGAGGAAANRALAQLVEKAGPGTHALWVAAIVSPAARAEIARNPDLASAAGLQQVVASLDFATGIDLRIIAELSTFAEAEGLARWVDSSVAEARRSRGAQQIGAGAVLDRLHARATGSTCEISLSVPAAEAAALTSRIEAAASHQ